MIAVELPPHKIVKVRGIVESITPLSSDVLDVAIKLDKPLARTPGQYCNGQFRGFPQRVYVPTWPIDPVESEDDAGCHFHIRRLIDGHVSSALGEAMLPGHKVKLTGPFGYTYFRWGINGRLILLSSGTGFAQTWAIAKQVLRENRDREIYVIVGASTTRGLYMMPALVHLAKRRGVTVAPVVSENRLVPPGVQLGMLQDFLPEFNAGDTVYVSGAPSLVDHVKRKSFRAGTTVYGDSQTAAPFELKEGAISRGLKALTEWVRPAHYPRPQALSMNAVNERRKIV